MGVYRSISNASNLQIQQGLVDVQPSAMAQACKIAPMFQGKTDKETARNVWTWLKTRVLYKPDGSVQKLRLPFALMREKTGDCKSFAIFAGSVLKCLGFEISYKLTGGPLDDSPRHVYIIARKNGNDYSVDATIGAFNKEAKYSRKKMLKWR